MAITSIVRILGGLGMIIFAGAVAAGATGAFFSDAETSTGNTFTGATLDLVLTGGEISTTVPFSVSDMMPGDTVDKNAVFTVSNSAWFQASLAVSPETVDANDGALAGALSFAATLTDDLLNPAALTQTGPTTFRADAALDPARTYTLVISTTLPSGTGDAAQNGTVVVDITLNATQSANQTNPF